MRGPSFANFPVFFPVSREFGAETGSQWTASSANTGQSRYHSLCLFIIPHLPFAVVTISDLDYIGFDYIQ